MEKCSHDLCTRDAIEGSQYCHYCIQLPTRECNHCSLPEKKDGATIKEKPAWSISDTVAGFTILGTLWVIIPIGLFFWGGLPFVVFYGFIWIAGFFILCMMNPCW
jgi:hypothetical protein